jgi:hypothetical protein
LPHRTVAPQTTASGVAPDSLDDDPDCLADMPHVFSVFRFRHRGGAVTYELTFTNLSDGPDRLACWSLIDGPVTVVDVVNTDTMSKGSNGVTREVTYVLALAN